MADFMLVHGAWHGAWCWRRVLTLLNHAGHRAHAVTLTGTGERSHLLSPEISLATHVEDLAQAIEAEELESPVLVLHSYAGMVGTALADRAPHQIGRLVYVDAMVPSPGESWGDMQPADVRASRLAAIARSPMRAMPAPDATLYGLVGADHAWVMRRMRPHPGGPYGERLDFDARRVASLPRLFISCTEPRLSTVDIVRRRLLDPTFWDGHWLPGSRFVELATGHDPMVSAPEELVQILLSPV